MVIVKWKMLSNQLKYIQSEGGQLSKRINSIFFFTSQVAYYRKFNCYPISCILVVGELCSVRTLGWLHFQIELLCVLVLSFRVFVSFVYSN